MTGCLHIPFDPVDPILADEQAVWLRELLSLAADLYYRRESRSHVVCVILEQSKSVTYQDQLFHARLAHRHGYRDEYRRIIVQLRLLLRYIIKSPIPWIYAARGDCLGVFYELASACDHTFIMERQAQIGFPEIHLGLFPLAGWFEEQVRNQARVAEEWRHRPVKDVLRWSTAPQHDFLVHWHQGDLTAEEVQRALLGLVAPGSKQADAPPLKDPLISCYELWLKRPLKAEYFPPAQDRFRELWEIVRQRLKKDESGQHFALWFIDAASAYITSPYFFSKWSGRPPPRRGGGLSDSLRAVVVDLQNRRPPLACIYEMLRSGRPIIFFDPDPNVLRRSLELVFAKLDRHYDVTNQQWAEQVSWCSGAETPTYSGIPLLRYGLQDNLEWQGQGQTFRGWVVANHPTTGVLVELSSDQRAGEAWFEMLRNQVIISRFPAEGVPISQLLRFWALDEMRRLASSCEDGMSGVVTALSGGDWGFLGDDIQWERFLDHRSHILAAGQPGIQLGRRVFGDEVLNPGPWRQIKRLGPKDRATIRIEWTQRRLSLHFLHLSVLMWAILIEAVELEELSAEQADLLVSRSLSLPSDWGRVSTFLNEWGLRRCQVYISRHWPELSHAVASLQQL
jgi:hypothetical protein